jgi:hypothetical protein
MNYFDNTVERIAQCKARYLEFEYLLFLERSKPQEMQGTIKIEKLLLESKAAYRELIQTASLINRDSSLFLGLNNDVHEYIKSKGHKPRKTFGTVFATAVVSSLFVSYSALWSVREFVTTGKALDLNATLLGSAISVSLWIWWSKKETF